MHGFKWDEVERGRDAALEQDPASWPALLDERCSHDAELRREVGELLARYATAQRLLETPPGAVAAALLAESRSARDAAALEGRRVGEYRVVREVGRGGMARVYLAERADGEFSQRVALKLLRDRKSTRLNS